MEHINRKEHRKKMVAPIIITFIGIVYFLFYFGMIIFTVENILAKVAFGIIPLCFVVLAIIVCHQRIDEIKKGEEDDLSQY